MFLIGLSDDELQSLDWENEQDHLSNYLYRVQKISSMYYTFRHHLSANLQDPKSEKSIRSFKAWERENPVKVKVGIDGKIEPVK